MTSIGSQRHPRFLVQPAERHDMPSGGRSPFADDSIEYADFSSMRFLAQ